MPSPRTIVVDAGERRVIRVDSGETFENVIIDITAPGASATIAAMGTDWTIRNVAFKGTYEGTERAFGVGDTGGGHSVIENVYIGDGVDPSVGSNRQPALGMWVTPEHNGTLDVERVNIQHAQDNSFYASAPGSNSNGQRGTVNFRNCYSKDSWVAHFRTAGGLVENCVAVNTSAGRNGRCIWGWPTKGSDAIVVRDCDFVCGGYAHGYDFGQSGETTDVYVENTDYAPSSSTRFQGNLNLEEDNVGHDPTDRVPEGCPTSVDDVFAQAGVELPADGGEDVGDDDPAVDHGLDYTLDFDGEGEYHFEVEEGPIALSLLDDEDASDHESAYLHLGGEPETGVDIEAADHRVFVDGDAKRAAGTIPEGGSHTFEYDSYVADIAVDDGVDARINGEHEPTWSMYPADGSEGRDWLETLPWTTDDEDEDEDDSGGEDPDSPKVEDLIDRIDALEADNRQLSEELADAVEAIETQSEQLDAQGEEVSSLRERLRGWVVRE